MKTNVSPEASQIIPVNKNYLEKVMNLAEVTEVLAHEDIYDVRGMKLISKGAKISRALQERLILHKLSKPLESSLTVENGVDVNGVVSEAERISETIPPITCLFSTSNAKGGYSPIQILKKTRLSSAMSIMLTITERGGEKALFHSIMVSLIAACLAKKTGLSESDQTAAALAGLLHDIGELYIEPQYLNRQRRLLPHEWRHIVVHPRIGEMLISELEQYPPSVAQAVAEHHERLDGAGYPRQLAGNHISPVGQVVSVAEAVSGIFMKEDRPLARAELALKIVPGEHAKDLISAVSKTLRHASQDKPAIPDVPLQDACQNAQGIFSHLASSIQLTQELLDSRSMQTHHSKGALTQTLNLLYNIRQAFSSTGLYVCVDKNFELMEANDLDILFEAGVAIKEIKWRFFDVARYLALQSVTLDPAEADALQPLITLLDGAN